MQSQMAHSQRLGAQRQAHAQQSVYAAHRLPAKRARCSSHVCAANTSEHSSSQQLQSRETLLSLGSLLGEDPEPSSSTPAADEPTPLYWWQVQPRQAAPPRQHAMAPGQHGRFINEDVFKTDVRTGRPTAHGATLDVPMVQPYMCYLLLMCQLTVYAFGTTLGVLRGPVVSQELFMYLGLDPSQLLAEGELWRLATCLSVHAGMAHLTLNSFALATLGTEAEALLGHSVFLYIYFASGLGGSIAALLLEGGSFSVGASGAIFGLIGALLGAKLSSKGPLPQKQATQWWLMLGVAGANVALSLLPDGQAISNAGHLGGFLVGLAAAYTMGPCFQVTTELDIPEGSMIVPDNAQELTVVIDKRGMLQRVAAGAGIAATLAVALAASLALLQRQ